MIEVLELHFGTNDYNPISFKAVMEKDQVLNWGKDDYGSMRGENLQKSIATAYLQVRRWLASGRL